MIITTFNSRGLGGVSKRNKIKELVRSNRVEFLAIQETKMEEISANLCYNLWGGEDCDWAFLPSEGNSGGILSIWSKTNNETNSVFVGEGYVGVCLDWGVLKHRCYIVNVYSKCDLPAKKRLWERLVELRKTLGEGVWCILGDFNTVCSSDERGANNRGSSSQRDEIFLFNNFVRDVDLEDLNVLGRRFTWYHPNGRAMSRIDRVLVSEEWGSLWGDSSLWVLPRDVSDHCPLILKEVGWDWGPKPFRFNNYWLENGDFKRVVEEAWSGTHRQRQMSFVLKEKFKSLKFIIKEWHNGVYGDPEDRVSKAVRDILELDVRGEEVGLCEEEVEMRKTLFRELWRLLKAKDSNMAQRARSKWLKEGDTNSKYFHKCVKSRCSRNSIKALREGVDWV